MNKTKTHNLSSTEVIPSLNLHKQRYRSIDIFRGIAIVGMIFANTIFLFESVPDWMKHIDGYGMHFPDIIAPMFIFAISLTYTMSFKRHVENEGYLKTYLRFLRRYAAFLGFGFLGGKYLFTSEGIHFGWGVLQAIGIAGIFTLLFIRFPRWARLALGVIFLIGYQAILTIPINIDGSTIMIGDLNYNSDHGGFIGSFSYGIMVLIGTGIIDDFRSTKKNQIFYYGLTSLLVGIITHIIWIFWEIPLFGGISKMIVTPAYVAFCIGFSCILFWILWLIFDDLRIPRKNIGLLEPYGKNAFFIYIVHPLFSYLPLWIFTYQAHLTIVISFSILNIGILWCLSYFMDRKGIYIII